MSGQGIEDEAAASLQNLSFRADREERSDPPAFSSFASDLDAEVGDCSERAQRRPGRVQVDLIQYQYHLQGSVRVDRGSTASGVVGRLLA